MRDYKTPILILIIYIIAFFFLPIVRSISIITLIFLVLHFTFHGAFVLIGKRAEGLHNKFIETHFSTMLFVGMYCASTYIYIATIGSIW